MQLKQGNYCPLLKKDCVGLQCNWFIQIRGTVPNTGKEVDEWGCSIAWLPHLLIENANQTRQAGAATESFRNEFVKSTTATINTMIALSNKPQQTNNEAPMRIVYDQTDDNKRG
jgi:hypothetical protein